jgi:PilZ domain
MPWKSWFTRTASKDRRKADRLVPSGLFAHYWDGAAPMAHPIREISSTGLYLLTEQRWYIGTVILMTIQEGIHLDRSGGRSIAVQARVVRAGPDGVAFELVLPEAQGSGEAGGTLSRGADKKSFASFLERLDKRRGGWRS